MNNTIIHLGKCVIFVFCATSIDAIILNRNEKNGNEGVNKCMANVESIIFIHLERKE